MRDESLFLKKNLQHNYLLKKSVKPRDSAANDPTSFDDSGTVYK